MKILEIIDNFICKYIGFNEQKIAPDILKKVGNNIVLINTESFKRHIHHEKWDEFLLRSFSKMNEDMKQKIGISMGSTLAKNLIISFDNVLIKKE